MPNFSKLFSVYQSKVDFHFCQPNEIVQVEEFIECHWKREHALAHNRALMNWQHYDKESNHYNFILATDCRTGEILALQGFITTRVFDSQITSPALCGAIWKSICEDKYPGVGILLQTWMITNVEHQVLFGLGMSNITERVNRSEHRKLGFLRQYYILNPKKHHFALADRIEKSEKLTEEVCEQKSFCLLDGQKFLKTVSVVSDKIPFFKSAVYYQHRFLEHPVYQYTATGIFQKDAGLQAVFFWRKCFYQGSCCLRIVDYIGDGSELQGCLPLFHAMLMEEDAEYIDFYQTGISRENMLSGGFLDRADSDIIIPNYYEPFLRQNVELNYAWEGPCQPWLFKGDADMDRPNRIGG